jgi:hypothetical protein
MTTTRTPEQEARARQLADDIRAQADEIIEEVAQLLSDTPDEKLFGDTEFVVRQRILQLVARTYTARIGQKKTATSAPASSARAADDRPPSMAIASETP